MRFQTGRKPPGEPLLSRLNGLAHLPVRPQTVRAVMTALTADLGGGLGDGEGDEERSDSLAPRTLLELDPGWLIAERSPERRGRVLRQAADSAWWPAALASGPAAEAVQQLWRHAVAASLACRNLAREHNDPDPAGLIRAGLLHGLGRWAVAAVDPDWLVRWMAEPDREARRRREVLDLGADLREIGRRLAERWGCEPLVVDAVWLHGEDDAALDAAAREPGRLALVREAVRRAESTPWAFDAPPGREAMPSAPHLRILVAEVQARCGAPFAADDATPHEERMTRENARLRLRLAELSRTEASQRRLIDAIADSSPDETPENWSLRAGRMWCGEPEVNAARVSWRDPSSTDDLDGSASPESDATPTPNRGASWTIPLEAAGRVAGEVQLWLDADVDALRDRLRPTRIVDAWKVWASRVADRALLERRLRAAVEGCRESARSERGRIQAAKLDALAEFAAGAGHELNNPLAVIVGRAQLLMAQAAEPETARSLGIILGQAQRTHRILRDLMFVARPSEPRPRPCRPADVLRACVADFRPECEARGIRLTAEFDDPELQAWTDPDGLRQIAEVLVRNAIQAAADGGGTIQLRAARHGRELRLWVADSGNGIGDAEAVHLFDPFYCGRQAGRGLGLGLPRAARFVERAGGALTWTSTPGHGSVFQVRLPWEAPPEESTAKSA
ncbi:ATP-binding protein [Planctomyces sp. SH-PL62]|uniref:ATP-binding protein n=1 Tax=Planctomyces sp. SH-PL62 TaxID=1636152 RepID=UPI00078E43EC|nr:ATP-binding protein [Planctomyces sp. SH-PL62]AMV38215.1 Sensor protein ZraS [Planctomyces sp. SH-PL62]